MGFFPSSEQLTQITTDLPRHLLKKGWGNQVGEEKGSDSGKQDILGSLPTGDGGVCVVLQQMTGLRAAVSKCKVISQLGKTNVGKTPNILTHS